MLTSYPIDSWLPSTPNREVNVVETQRQMDDSSLPARIADRDQIAAVGAAVRAWEPTLDLDVESGSGLLYAPDATLYALNLGGPCTLSTDRRRQAIGVGDLVVVPPGLGLDVEPGGNFLRLLDYGPPPLLFRERFIQVQGFAVVTGAAGEDSPPRGFRVDHERWALAANSAITIPAGPWDARLFVGLGGWAEVTSGTFTWKLHSETVLFTEPGPPLRLEGAGPLVALRFASEPVHRQRIRPSPRSV